MKKKLLCLSFLLSFYSNALLVGPIKIRGKVVSYNKTTVVLEVKGTEKGKKKGKKTVNIPREFIPKKYKLRTGKIVYALLRPEDLNRLSEKK